MSILANRTERAALKMLARALRYFDSLAYLKMTAEDDSAARCAENQIRSIIETNGCKAEYKTGKGTIIHKIKSR